MGFLHPRLCGGWISCYNWVNLVVFPVVAASADVLDPCLVGSISLRLFRGVAPRGYYY